LERQAGPAGGASDRTQRASPERPRAGGIARIEPASQADRFVLNSRQLSYLLPPDHRERFIEVSDDGDTWETVFIAEPSEDWRVVTIDLSSLTMPAVYVRVTAG
jgi:hypothetical protein